MRPNPPSAEAVAHQESLRRPPDGDTWSDPLTTREGPGGDRLLRTVRALTLLVVLAAVVFIVLALVL